MADGELILPHIPQTIAQSKQGFVIIGIRLQGLLKLYRGVGIEAVSHERRTQGEEVVHLVRRCSKAPHLLFFEVKSVDPFPLFP